MSGPVSRRGQIVAMLLKGRKRDEDGRATRLCYKEFIELYLTE